jgi:hypothetical protein
MENILDNNKPTEIEDCEEIQVENIPLCSTCLFEIKEGKYLCNTCRVNVCPVHAKSHLNNKHKLIKLIKC